MGLLQPRSPVLFSLFLCICVADTARATPRDDLLQLVPEEISLCLVVNNLREHSQNLATAPWAASVRGSSLGKALLQSPEWQQFHKIEKDLHQVTKVGWPQIRDDILGDCAVFAFHHGEDGKPHNERGLVLLWARDPALLARMIQLINQEQKKTGELKEVQEKQYKGIKYFLRQEVNQQQFYLHKGSLFAFTTQEPLLRQVIDRHLSGPAEKKTVLVRSFAKLDAEQALLTLWVNPRAFDWLWKPGPKEGTEAALVKQTFGQYWQALDALAVSVAASKELEAKVTLQGRPSALPGPAQKFLQTALQPSELWPRFPARAAVTAAARLDAEALLQMLEGFMTPAARESLHESLQKHFGTVLSMDFVKEVLPCLGPDIGLCLAPAPEGKAVPDLLFALRIQPGSGETPVDKAVFKAMQDVAVLSVFAFNSKQKDVNNFMRIKSENQDDIEVKYLTQKQFPDGFRPAFALKESYLVLASSPHAIRQFAKSSAKGTDIPLLHVNFSELARLLKANHKWIVDNTSSKEPSPEQAPGRWLEGLLETLTLFDSLHVQQQSAPGQVTWSFRLKMTVTSSPSH